VASIFSIEYDVDSYLARGGRLSNLRIPGDREFELGVSLLCPKPEHVWRWARFMQKLSDCVTGNETEDETVNDVFSEKQLRQLWAETL